MKILRHEIKYYINYYEFEKLRARLRPIVSLDKHALNEEGYHIRSLYFDDVFDNALYEKNSGVNHREKYRIRIYNKSDYSIKLERKSKYGDHVCKQSIRISRTEYENIMSGSFDFLKTKESEVARDFYLKCSSQHMKPKIIVDYVREAYTYPFGDVRITFDKQLMMGVNGVDIFEPQLVTVNAIRDKRMILEIKYNEFLPTHIQNLIQLDNCNRSAISKYVICREEGMGFYKI